MTTRLRYRIRFWAQYALRAVPRAIWLGIFLVSTSASAQSQDWVTTSYLRIPNFGAHPTVSAARSGNWSDPGMWSTGQLPGAGDSVSIGSGAAVIYDIVSDSTIESVTIASGSQLVFRTDINTRITVRNLLVLEGGELQIGTQAHPVSASVKAEVVFPNVAIDTAKDPEQYGQGLVGLGKVIMHGAAHSASFVRLALEPTAGQTSLALSQSVSGWQSGDKLVLPDSNQRVFQDAPTTFEEVTIASVSVDGRTITLTSPLQFGHPGARNPDGVLEFLPHVANRTRNVIIRSASSTGVRGHVLFTHRAEVDIRYTGFGGLGRTRYDLGLDSTTFDTNGAVTHVGTNQDDRYAVEFAHLFGPSSPPANGYQYTFIGNAVFCQMMNNPFKWGLTVFDSHYGLIRDNFLYNWAGSAFVTKSGNEAQNVIERNFALRGLGLGDRDGGGNEGVGFWFRGPSNFVRDNVAANFSGSVREAAYGFKYFFVYVPFNLHLPNFAGADTTVAGQYTETFIDASPILEFARNETYGMENGLSYWWVNAFGGGYPQVGGESVIHDFRAWNFYLYGIYAYETNGLTIDGFVARANASSSIGMVQGDYLAMNFVLTHADIQGTSLGILRVSGSTNDTTLTIKDSYFRNLSDLYIGTNYTSGYHAEYIKPRRIELRNVKFDPLPGQSHTSIKMVYEPSHSNIVHRDQVFVYDYNSIPGNDFQVFYNEQAPAFVLPQTVFNNDGTRALIGSPEAGLTNQQNWNKYSIALAGAVAPCTDTASHPEINGIVCANSGSNHPPSLSHINNRSVSAGQLVQFRAFATDPDNDHLTFSAFSIPTSTAQINPSTGDFTWTPTLGGTYQFVASVHDDGSPSLADQQTFTITVSGGNTGPSGQDDDGDGLSNNNEELWGTDPNNPDTNGDGIPDGAAVDSGVSPTLGSTVCASWNSNLGMLNVLEEVAVSPQPIGVESTIYDIDGQPTGGLTFGIASGAEFDVLVHDLAGWIPNSYGSMCSTTDGGPGTLRSTMVYYQPAPPGSSRMFQFALGIPVSRGRAGSQFVPFNTYQPSLAPRDANYLVANWGQLTNENAVAKSGTLLYWGRDGSMITQRRLTLPPRARGDYALHEVGSSLVGVVEWRPDDPSAIFNFENVRYYYDNNAGLPSFHSAFRLPAHPGSSSALTAPFTAQGATAVVEATNTTDTAINFILSIYAASGQLITEIPRILAPRATEHFILDTIAPSQQGIVVARSSEPKSLILTVMHYDRQADGSVRSIRGIDGVPPLGIALRGSYNTFLNQDAQLWLLNPTDSAQTATYSLVRSDGTVVVDGKTVAIPAHGLTLEHLNDSETPDHYGVVTVHPDAPDTLIAWVLRVRPGEYVIPLQLTQ